MAAFPIFAFCSIAIVGSLFHPTCASAREVRLERTPQRFDPHKGRGDDTAATTTHAFPFPSSSSSLSEGWKARGHRIQVRGPDGRAEGTLALSRSVFKIKVGTGAGQRAYRVFVDTGSSNTAVPGATCTTCGTANLYNHSESPTSALLGCGDPMCLNCDAMPLGAVALPSSSSSIVGDRPYGRCPYGPPECRRTGGGGGADSSAAASSSSSACGFSITYGGSSIGTEGFLLQDELCVPNSDGSSLCGRVYMGQYTAMYPAAAHRHGIMGLAFPENACNPTCQPTVLDALIGQGALNATQNHFGLCITPSLSGVIDFGGSNASRYHGELQFTRVTTQRWYNIGVQDIRVGNVSLGLPPFLYAVRNDCIGAFVDTGMGTFLVNPLAFDIIQNMMTQTLALPDAGKLFGQQCPSMNQSAVDAYPAIDVVLKGDNGRPDFALTITGNDYLVPFGGESDRRCLGIVSNPGVGVILGDIFMMKYYVLFDRGNSRLGFAPLKSC